MKLGFFSCVTSCGKLLGVPFGQQKWESEGRFRLGSEHTVDGRNPAPVDMVNIP